jgi:hypothetical protein
VFLCIHLPLRLHCSIGRHAALQAFAIMLTNAARVRSRSPYLDLLAPKSSH